MMNKKELRAYLYDNRKSQKDLAAEVGLTQGAISHMLVQKREVYVVTTDDGRIWLEEVRKIGSAA
jgi:DNA-binding Xre family transcriptional regulator